MEIEISIVVPVYNSSAILPELIMRIEKAMSHIGKPYEIILTDDCSTDNTWSTINSIVAKHSFIKGFRLSENCRQWCSTLFGLSNAQGKYIVTIDDDLEYEPYEIVKLYEAINTGSYVVVFGLPQNKYALQGKNQQLSMFRKSLMHKLWNSPVTDSFRIMHRNLIFDGSQFLPETFIDAYIVNHVNIRHIGYVETISNRRFAGNSNVRFALRIKLFALYFLHFSKYRFNNTLLIVTWFATAGLLSFVAFSGLTNTAISIVSLPILLVALLFSLPIISLSSKPLSFKRKAFIINEVSSINQNRCKKP